MADKNMVDKNMTGKNNILIVVDVQNDFVSGSLGSKDAQDTIQNIVEKIEDFDGDVIFTQDTHGADYLNTQEGEKLPVEHCVKDTWGWELADEVKALKDTKEYSSIEKPTFGSTELMEILSARNSENPISSIELIGFCTDICVVSNALLLKAAMPDVPIAVDASCCAGTSPDAHKAALDTMASCQIEIL